LEPLVYTSIEPLHEDYKNDILTPQLLKPAVYLALNNLLAPIQKAYSTSSEWQEIALKAYPDEDDLPPKKEKKEKKEKKVKNRGTHYPGASKNTSKGPEEANP